MDDETAAAVEAAIDGALGSIQAAEDSASNIDTSTITASAPDTSALQSAADALRASASSAITGINSGNADSAGDCITVK